MKISKLLWRTAVKIHKKKFTSSGQERGLGANFFVLPRGPLVTWRQVSGSPVLACAEGGLLVAVGLSDKMLFLTLKSILVVSSHFHGHSQTWGSPSEHSQLRLYLSSRPESKHPVYYLAPWFSACSLLCWWFHCLKWPPRVVSAIQCS